jgi:hypothetical protein
LGTIVSADGATPNVHITWAVPTTCTAMAAR